MTFIGSNKGLFRRDEGFRLTLKEPAKATITIIESTNKKFLNNREAARVIDISLQGAKILTETAFEVHGTGIKLDFEIGGEKINVSGELVWKRDNYQGYFYGITFLPGSYSDRELLNALKKYVKTQK